MTKKLFKIFHTYGKSSGDELAEEFVAKDNSSSRQGLLDDWCACADFYGVAPEKFVSGESDYISFDRDGGDWDDPTGGYIQVTSYEEAVAALTSYYSTEIEKLNLLFSKDVKEHEG